MRFQVDVPKHAPHCGTLSRIFVAAVMSLLLIAPLAFSEWTQVTTSAPWGRVDRPACVSYEGSLWLMYGYDGHALGVWRSSNGADWSAVACAQSIGDRGGNTPVNFLDRIWLVGAGTAVQTAPEPCNLWNSPNGITWTLAQASPAWAGTRNVYGVLAFDNRLWIMGGLVYPDRPALNDVWYSYDGIEWVRATEHAGWMGRCDMGAIVHDEKMWVLGGSYPRDWETSGVLNDVWCSTNGIEWTQVTPAAPWLPRDSHQVVSYNGRIWVLGGRNVTGDTNHWLGDVWSSPDGLNWTQMDEMAPWGPLYGRSATVFGGRIWLTGGGNSTDIWSFQEITTFRFTELPQGGWAEEGNARTLSVAVEGAVGNVTYQWRKGGVDISGATDAELQFTSLTTGDTGWYTCVVTDESKAVHQTDPVPLEVFPADSLPAVNGLGVLLTAALLAGLGGAVTFRHRRSGTFPEE